MRHPVRRKKIRQNLDVTGVDRSLAYHAHIAITGSTPHTLHFSRGWQSASVNRLAHLTFEELLVHRQSPHRAPALVSSSTSRQAIVMRIRSVAKWGPRRRTRRQQLDESLSPRTFRSRSKPRASVAGSSPKVRPDNVANVLQYPRAVRTSSELLEVVTDRGIFSVGWILMHSGTVENLGRSRYPTPDRVERSLAREHEQRDTRRGSFRQAMGRVGVLRCSNWK